MWSIAAAASIIWVVIAYLFTIIDSFSGDVTTTLNANGQSVGSAWLWLLPVVVGWLQISPKCDSVRLHKAVRRANRIAYVATPLGGPELVSLRSREYAISLRPGTYDLLRRDEGCTVPIFNYARFLPWVGAVETVAGAFQMASERARTRVSLDPKTEEEKKLNSAPPVLNRMGTLVQVEECCASMGESQRMRRTGWGPGVWSRMFVASVLALLLQWGTASAAVVVVWFTPTTGKSSRYDECVCCNSYRAGCRSWMSVGVIHTLRCLVNSRLATARCFEYLIPLCDDDISPRLGLPPHLRLPPSHCTPNVYRTSSHWQSLGSLQRSLDCCFVHVPVQ